MSKNWTKCVYKISFTNYHKIYIGSSIRWPYRKREHLYDLENKKHHNVYLQRATNKYGIENIIIEPLEFCLDYKSLLEREQFWIDSFKSTNKKYGFNLVKMVRSSGTVGYKYTKKQRKKISLKSKERMTDKKERDKLSMTVTSRAIKGAYGGNFIPKTFTLFSPSGQKTEIYNLSDFCRQNDLDYPKMIKVNQGEIIEYMGWKKDLNRKNLVKRSYIFLNPEGEKIEVFGLKKFCKENNLSHSTMSNIHRGVGNTSQGWRKYLPNNEKTHHKGQYFKIKIPSGEIIEGNNLGIFCEKHNLKKRCFRGKKIYKNFELLSLSKNII